MVRGGPSGNFLVEINICYKNHCKNIGCQSTLEKRLSYEQKPAGIDFRHARSSWQSHHRYKNTIILGRINPVLSDIYS